MISALAAALESGHLNEKRRMITKSSRARDKAFSLLGLVKECLAFLAYSVIAVVGVAIVLTVVWVTEEVVR